MLSHTRPCWSDGKVKDSGQGQGQCKSKVQKYTKSLAAKTIRDKITNFIGKRFAKSTVKKIAMQKEKEAT